ncbi:hypothetical protein CPC08DRAFT_628233 [Agrocybe pediades]|nr:hypothetical protein CPC08DRAFT_628233 [Agrocybe pediades]
MSDTVIREVSNGVWTFSKPFARFGILPIGGRSTAIKLQDGGVWMLASTPLDTETRETLDKLGPVKYIISPDVEHHLFLSQYKEAYPTAKVIAPEGVVAQHPNKSLVFDGLWGRDPPDTKYGFEKDIEHVYFSGFKNKDVAFLHRQSKSLIEADLLMNLPPTEQYSKSKTSPSFFGVSLSPSSWLHSKLTYRLGEDKDAMRRDAKIVAGWDFERIIPCHGDVIEKDAKQAWHNVFKSFLD